MILFQKRDSLPKRILQDSCDPKICQPIYNRNVEDVEYLAANVEGLELPGEQYALSLFENSIVIGFSVQSVIRVDTMLLHHLHLFPMMKIGIDVLLLLLNNYNYFLCLVLVRDQIISQNAKWSSSSLYSVSCLVM